MWAIEIMKERVKSDIISFLLKGDLFLSGLIDTHNDQQSRRESDSE